MSSRFRRLTDLFIEGKTVTLPDESHLFVRAINSYERDECISDAQVARSRLILALRENGDERIKVEALLEREGRDRFVDDLVAIRAEDKYADVLHGLEDDPDWSERLAVLKRTDPTQAAKPSTPEEDLLVTKLWTDYYAEVDKRLEGERDYARNELERLDDRALLEEYVEAWLNKRGTEVANAEYLLTEMWYATRYCEAIADTEGALDHARCNGHTEKVFTSKADARSIPDGLAVLIRAALNELAMEARDPKGSGSAPSSSDSPPAPSAQEASTASISTEAPQTVPGT